MFSIKTKGDFKKFDKFVKKMSQRDYMNVVDRYARMGVEALKNATPKDSGETAQSWDYEIQYFKNSTKIMWTNSKVTKDGTPIVLLLQYGHATRGGGYVQGLDFINPALKPVFIDLAEAVWKEVTSY